MPLPEWDSVGDWDVVHSPEICEICLAPAIPGIALCMPHAREEYAALKDDLYGWKRGYEIHRAIANFLDDVIRKHLEGEKNA